MRQARIVLADARRYRKKKGRPAWSPMYGQLVDAAVGVDAEMKRARRLAERDERQAARERQTAEAEA